MTIKKAKKADTPKLASITSLLSDTTITFNLIDGVTVKTSTYTSKQWNKVRSKHGVSNNTYMEISGDSAKIAMREEMTLAEKKALAGLCVSIDGIADFDNTPDEIRALYLNPAFQPMLDLIKAKLKANYQGISDGDAELD